MKDNTGARWDWTSLDLSSIPALTHSSKQSGMQAITQVLGPLGCCVEVVGGLFSMENFDCWLEDC